MSKLLDILKHYRSLDLEQAVNFQKFSEYTIVHHSTAIEGSTLTDIETQVLLDKGMTPKGKPLEHSLMVRDHYAALQFILQQQDEKQIDTVFIQQINALVMKNTGSIFNTALGDINSANGEFRKGNVSAGGSYFVGYDKVPSLTKAFAVNLSENMSRSLSDLDALLLSFSAHYDLVSIHPFYDGNGRTSRLLMNYVQQHFKLPLGIVFAEDRADYIQALVDTRKSGDIEIFYAFMNDQYCKQLLIEIEKFKRAQEDTEPKSTGFSFSILL